MSEQWDEFSKSLSEPVPRRESLRRLGAVFAALFLPLWVWEQRGEPRVAIRVQTSANAAIRVSKRNASLSAASATRIRGFSAGIVPVATPVRISRTTLGIAVPASMNAAGLALTSMPRATTASANIIARAGPSVAMEHARTSTGINTTAVSAAMSAMKLVPTSIAGAKTAGASMHAMRVRTTATEHARF